MGWDSRLAVREFGLGDCRVEALFPRPTFRHGDLGEKHIHIHHKNLHHPGLVQIAAHHTLHNLVEGRDQQASNSTVHKLFTRLSTCVGELIGEEEVELEDELE